MQSPAWPHAPTHQLSAAGAYIVTAGTYQKAHFFRGAERLSVLQRGLFKLTAEYGWRLEAWAIFSNHYHFVAHSPPSRSAESLSEMIGILHQKTAAWVNRLDQSRNRKAWYNFWETRLTNQASYLARLNYVHQNPVKHGLVPIANAYPWCSAPWFERVASNATVKSVYRFKTDRISVADESEVDGDW